MVATNTSDVPLTGVEPDEDCSTILSSATGTGDFTNCVFESDIPAELLPGQSAFFIWDGTITGDIGDVLTFCNNAFGFDPALVPGDLPDPCDTLEIIDPNDCGGCDDGGGDGGENIILIDDLLIKPSLFLTIPSPYGSVSSTADDDIGLWGVQVANPLNFTIGVSKVTITAFAPGANSNLKIFDATANNENVSPGTPGLGMGDWIPNAENVLVWKNVAAPITLGPYQTETFMVKVKPWTNGVDLEAIIVQTSVFSTAGSFGKAAYQTTMFDASGADSSPVANVYLSTTVDSTNTLHHLGHYNNLQNGTAQELILVMADMDTDDKSWITQNSEFIVNIPREWSIPIIDPAKTTKIITNATEPKIISHSDGSFQIIGLLSENIGDTPGTETATITFSSTPPEKENERLYVMHVLGNGLTNDNLSVGPLSEIILHVIGNVTGYP